MKKSAIGPERVIASIVALLFLIIALRKVQRFFFELRIAVAMRESLPKGFS